MQRLPTIIASGATTFVLPACVVQAARNSVTRESAALQEQRAAIQSLLAQLEQREEALGQVRQGRAAWLICTRARGLTAVSAQM